MPNRRGARGDAATGSPPPHVVCVLLYVTVLASLLFVCGCNAVTRPSDVKLNFVNCGRRFWRKTNSTQLMRRRRVVGGTYAGQAQWPWMVSIKNRALRKRFETMQPKYMDWRSTVAEHEAHICGATLISDRWVITAKHCIFENYTDENVNNPHYAGWVAELGGLNFNKRNNASSVFVEVDRVVLVNGMNYNNDLALMHLAKRVNFTENIQPICMPNGIDFDWSVRPTKSFCYVTGWGTEESLTSPKVTPKMKYSRVFLLPTNSTSYKNSLCPVQSTESPLICMTRVANALPCRGDSGGPLFCTNATDPEAPDARFTLIGVVNSGTGCTKTNDVTFFADISQYMPMILRDMAKSSSAPSTHRHHQFGMWSFWCLTTLLIQTHISVELPPL